LAPGAAIGLAAGVVTGICLAAVAGAMLVGGGTAYAFNAGAGSSMGATVANNPLYESCGAAGTNPLHKG